ncbi:MAG TPA: hypothetical protein VK501_13925 [Baekduia sp.]|uniref:hypothetical protein n=1 Tax=Baekduia sp. TaxID=2600305 RepID=UPI002C6697EE|nr:hypothetical protein [Baekduia sp.]HMJ35006.1 hypothetical protein [Baekduia sp.]
MSIQLSVRGTLCALLCAATVGIAAPAAHAAFGVDHFDAGTCTKNTEPAPQCTRDSTPDYWFQQAAGHPPFGITDFSFNTTGLLGTPDGNVKDVRVDLPPGLSVNPEAAPHCTAAQLQAGLCPAASRVGTNYTRAASPALPALVIAPVYNMEQPPGMPALFGFAVPATGDVIYLEGGVAWDGDYHESFTIRDLPNSVPLVSSRLVFDGRAGDGTFITLPSGCSGPQTTYLHVDSYQDPGNHLAYSATTPVGVTGCEALPFAPTISTTTDTRQAGAPAGVTIDVNLPQNPDGKDKPNSATLRDAEVVLPEGMSINPSAATGLEGCTDEQLGKGTTRPVACPAASAIGDVAIETPVLPAHALTGKVYLGQPLSGDPLSGDEYRLFLDAESPRYGVSVRLVGHVKADPSTGRLTTTFTDNPQVPVSLVRVALRGGDRAPLVNPPTCGTYTARATMTSWGGQTVVSESSFAVDAGCPGATGFAPSFSAAPSDARAGSSPGSFGVSVARGDADQVLSRIDVSLPPGLLAKPAGIPLCGDAQAAAGTCPEASRVGSVAVTAGAGPAPFALEGRVYLTGPYAGGPYGLSVVVPAVAGPFDLGLVVVRASVQLDRTDAHVRVVSDPLPTILDGIPLLVRSVRVTIDRPDAMRNPTSCAPLEITGSFVSAGGLTASGSSPFAPADCQALAFTPTTTIGLTGPKETVDGRHPGVDAKMVQKGGEANIRQVKVTLPLSLALDPDNARALCEYADGLRGSCPESSVIGRATAVTPLLDQPLTGKVYFVKGVRFDKAGRAIRTLPTLLVLLRGEIALDLRASTAVDARSRLVTTFDAIPDAAVSSFRMVLEGGRHGILVVTTKRDVCSGAQKAVVAATGQNGKARNVTTALQTPCPKAPKLGRARAAGGRVALTVKAAVAGRIVARGAAGRLGTVKRKVRKGQTVRLSLKVTRAAARRMARGRKVSDRVSVRFTATNGAGRTVRSNLVRLRR